MSAIDRHQNQISRERNEIVAILAQINFDEIFAPWESSKPPSKSAKNMVCPFAEKMYGKKSERSERVREHVRVRERERVRNH